MTIRLKFSLLKWWLSDLWWSYWGTGAVFLYASSFHFYMDFLDIAAPSVILAQAIGRWGNFMNHEAYGPATTRQFLKISIYQRLSLIT